MPHVPIPIAAPLGARGQRRAPGWRGGRRAGEHDPRPRPACSRQPRGRRRDRSRCPGAGGRARHRRGARRARPGRAVGGRAGPRVRRRAGEAVDPRPRRGGGPAPRRGHDGGGDRRAGARRRHPAVRHRRPRWRAPGRPRIVGRLGRPRRARPHGGARGLLGREVDPRRGRHAGGVGDGVGARARVPHGRLPRLLPARRRTARALAGGRARRGGGRVAGARGVGRRRRDGAGPARARFRRAARPAARPAAGGGARARRRARVSPAGR